MKGQENTAGAEKASIRTRLRNDTDAENIRLGIRNDYD